jgi:hypothetical protein
MGRGMTGNNEEGVQGKSPRQKKPVRLEIKDEKHFNG